MFNFAAIKLIPEGKIVTFGLFLRCFIPFAKIS